MLFQASDLKLVLPLYHAPDMFQKEGGPATNQQVVSEVDSLFLPGTIVGSDSSETVRYQYRKCFVKNTGRGFIGACRVYGFNVKSNNIVKFALESHQGFPILDGSETISNYLTQPVLSDPYQFTERFSNQGVTIGNSGILSSGRGQGIWMRQAIPRNFAADASDHFQFGLWYKVLS